MPKVIRNWRAHLRRYWGVLALAAVLSGLEVMMPMLRGALPIGEYTRAVLYGLVTAGAFATRLIAMKLMGDE